jgi:hypothetical protein
MGVIGAAEVTLLRRWQRYRFVIEGKFWILLVGAAGLEPATR